MQAARWFGAAHGPTLSLYCQGLNQSVNGTHNNAALINLHLFTGQIGKPGAGPFSLTGQPNAMGGREVGALANQLAAHRDLGNAAAPRRDGGAVGRARCCPQTPGKSAVEMFEAAADGAIKLLWIACTNPAQSMPDQTTVRRALERCEFVIVQEAFRTTATCGFADLLLPASHLGRKGRQRHQQRAPHLARARGGAPRRARRAPTGASRSTWRGGSRPRLRRRAATAAPAASLSQTPEAVWNEHRETTRGRDLDITGLSYAMLDRRVRSSGRCPAAPSAAASASTKTAASCSTTAARASPPSSRCRWPSRATCATRSR